MSLVRSLDSPHKNGPNPVGEPTRGRLLDDIFCSFVVFCDGRSDAGTPAIREHPSTQRSKGAPSGDYVGHRHRWDRTRFGRSGLVQKHRSPGRRGATCEIQRPEPPVSGDHPALGIGQSIINSTYLSDLPSLSFLRHPRQRARTMTAESHPAPV